MEVTEKAISSNDTLRFSWSLVSQTFKLGSGMKTALTSALSSLGVAERCQTSILLVSAAFDISHMMLLTISEDLGGMDLPV